ncbi:hypothetical protein ANRL3_01374 [Anaerolineae bacterium]|nr:hypothetical protein ANRL3_01374 [Anaerolineae bacterium]
MLAFDLHGLIRRLGRLPLGSVLIILVFILRFQHMLSLDVGSIVGVVGLSIELNDVFSDTSEF